MALDIRLKHVQQEEENQHVIADNTGTYDAINNTGGYGAPNPVRTDRANYLMVSKNDKSGNRTYLTVTNSDPLNTLEWTVTSTLDGWHQATLLSFNKWSGATAYVANTNAIYYTVTGKFYKAIQASTNIAPDSGSGPSYWEEIVDFTAIQQGYTNVEVIDFNFLVDSRTSLLISDDLYDKINEDFTCKLSIEDAAHPLNLIAMLEAAQSKALDDKFDQAEQIIRAIEDCLD